MALGLKNKSRHQLRIFNRGIYVIGILSGIVLVIYFTMFLNLGVTQNSSANQNTEAEKILGIDEENIISYYSFDKYPVLKSTKGLSASTISKYANIKGSSEIRTPGLSAGNQSENINMVFDIHPKFNSAGISVQCTFKNLENTGTLFKRGKNFELSFSGNDLRIKYSLFQNDDSPIKVNKKIPNALPKVAEMTEVKFLYEPTLGLAVVQINGKNVWKNRTQPNLALNWESTKPFVFASTVNASGSDEVIINDLLIATTTPPIKLPFELLSFSSVSDKNEVIIDWYTFEENETEYFIIEKSIDGKKFEEVGRTRAAGHSSELMNYTMTDQFPKKGINFYRLNPSSSKIPPSLLPVTAVDHQNKGAEASR
ncbi:MAG: hypothetical protein HKN75_01555 [Bacteroidia bacterium]|nr:hypothetical protein [Bacteroidia bacterium]